jgi:dehydrogenase/reductase SDR family protein 12
MVNERQLSSEGIEVNFATNTLGTMLLTELLVPHMESEGGDARIITVSSGGALNAKLDTDDLQSSKGKFDGMLAYAQHKRQQIELTDYWAARHHNIRFYSMHPGWADTNALVTSMPSFHHYMQGWLRTPEQGADSIVWLAVSNEARALPSGSFILDRAIASKHITPVSSTTTTSAHVESFVRTCRQLINGVFGETVLGE